MADPTTLASPPPQAATDLGADADIEEMKRMLESMEQEADEIKKMEEAAKKISGDAGLSGAAAVINSEEVDTRSVYVGSVDFSSTPEELQTHFASCGTINRVTILCNKLTGAPKGYAYVEFQDAAAITTALGLNDSLFKGRLIKVLSKRTNVPGMARGRGRGRGFRGGFRGYRGGFRGRGRARGYSPY